jgi:hypothetical protein
MPANEFVCTDFCICFVGIRENIWLFLRRFLDDLGDGFLFNGYQNTHNFKWISNI